MDMPFHNKIPPVKITVTKNTFNQLLELLTNNEEKCDEIVKEQAIRLKGKLLTYSVPFSNDSGQLFADIYFYVSEASMLIKQMLLLLKEKKSSIDYYSILENARKTKEIE